MSSLTVVTAASGLAVSVADAKAHAVIEHAHDDGLIVDMIRAATQYIEGVTGIQTLSTTLRYTLDDWPCDATIRLPRYPVSAVSSVKYMASAGVLSTISSSAYQVDTYGSPARIVPAVGATWPTVLSGTINGVQVEFVAGYGSTADSVNQQVKAAIIRLAAHYYENRELQGDGNTGPAKSPYNELPQAVMRLLDGVRMAELCL